MDTLELSLDIGKFFSNKKYKEQTVKEIVAYLCALMNGNGGDIKLSFHKAQRSTAHYNKCIRIIEQSFINIVGAQMTVLNLSIKIVDNKVVCRVKKSESFITTRYNLCLPSTTQVLSVSSTEKIKDNILNRRHVVEPVEVGSHHKTFIRHEFCGLTENKEIELKLLEASAKNSTKLVQRMLNNKLTDYVSAFANYNGGHIYYGITDDGVVEGEQIPNRDIDEITKKVGKAINKMIWPKWTGQPKRGEHWEIFIEPVVDENSKPIPSTFVIVIYIAPCLGGVFTEEPECYEMVEGKVTKMSFAAWKKRILESAEIKYVPHTTTSSITWISKTTGKLCTKAFCILTLCLNNGDWKGFQEKSKEIEEWLPNIVELKLVVLLKRIILHSRRHDFETASVMLQTYNELLQNAAERGIFEVLGLYVQAAYNRAKGNEGNALNFIRDLLVRAMTMAEWLMPGLVTTLVYLFAGTMTDRFDNTFLRPPNELSNKALEHLQQLMADCPIVHADLVHKAHIIRATSYLGCNFYGELVDQHVDNTRVTQANSSILAIEQSIGSDNSKLTHYREIQLHLVKSICCFRRSQNQPDKRTDFIREALKFSKNAENLAGKWEFHEMVSWSKSLQGLFTA